MDKKAFYNKISSILQKKLGAGCQISFHTICEFHKPEDYIMIKEKSFYHTQYIPLTDFYEDFLSGYPLADISDEIINIYRTINCCDDAGTEIPYEYAAVKDKLFPKIVCLHENKKILTKVPCIEIMDHDILIIFCAELGHINHASLCCMVTNRQLSIWKVSKEELIRTVLSNVNDFFLPQDKIKCDNVNSDTSEIIDYIKRTYSH